MIIIKLWVRIIVDWYQKVSHPYYVLASMEYNSSSKGWVYVKTVYKYMCFEYKIHFLFAVSLIEPADSWCDGSWCVFGRY